MITAVKEGDYLEVVVRFRQQWEAVGNLDPLPKSQPSKFSIEEKKYVIYYVSRKQKFYTINKIRAGFKKKFRKDISPRTIRRLLKSAGYSYKKCYTRTKVNKKKKAFHSTCEWGIGR